MWCSLEDFKLWLKEAGLPAPSSAASNLVSAKKQWQRDTGFTPFVAGDDTEKWFSPADFGNVLDFDGGYVSVTSVGVATEPQGDTTDKTLLTDYVLEREQEDGPYTRLKWLSNPFTGLLTFRSSIQEQTIKVTGKRGYCIAGSEAAIDSQEAVFQLAAALLDPIVSGSDGPVKKVTQGPVTLEFDTANGLDRAGTFMKFYQSKVSEYRRIVI